MISEPVALVLACAVDAALGDPRWLPHPVVLMGRMIERTEAMLRQRAGDLRKGGVVLALVVVSAAGLSAYAAQRLLMLPSGGPAAAIAAIAYVYLVSTTIACRGLLESVREVLAEDEINAAREKLSHIVGRDTSGLDRDGIRRAALETLAENASDGIIAPLFYFAIGGLPLAFMYKAANTLDSMVGYRNERYRELGWASARLDDFMNYLPSRITGLLISAAAGFVDGAQAARAMSIMMRDGRKHKSPNAGIPEAAMAGALGIRLGGPSSYNGEIVDKPWIGDDKQEGYEGKSGPALRLVSTASLMGMGLAISGTLMRTYIW